MAKFQVVGYEHNAGHSSRTGKDYDIHIIHAVAERPFDRPGKCGCPCYNLKVHGNSGILVPDLQPGDTIEVGFDMTGRIEDLYVVG